MRAEKLKNWFSLLHATKKLQPISRTENGKRSKGKTPNVFESILESIYNDCPLHTIYTVVAVLNRTESKIKSDSCLALNLNYFPPNRTALKLTYGQFHTQN